MFPHGLTQFPVHLSCSIPFPYFIYYYYFFFSTKVDIDFTIYNDSGALVATKTDLKQRRAISGKEGREFASSKNLEYFECSAVSSKKYIYIPTSKQQCPRECHRRNHG